MKRRTALMGAMRGPWIPVHKDTCLVVSGLTQGVVDIEVKGPLTDLRHTYDADGRYEIASTGWLRASSSLRCPTLVCQLEH